jgi:hypothetical protein
MGNLYSILDSGKPDVDTILKEEMVKLEKNVKQIDKMLELLNLKCDKVISKIDSIDDKTTELVQKNESTIQFNEWDYYDLNQVTALTKKNN